MHWPREEKLGVGRDSGLWCWARHEVWQRGAVVGWSGRQAVLWDGREGPPTGWGVERAQGARGARPGLRLWTDSLPPFVLCCPGDWVLCF